jgi:hypothetical protein
MNFKVTVELLAPLLYVRVLVALLYVREAKGFSLDPKIVILIVDQLAEYHLSVSH